MVEYDYPISTGPLEGTVNKIKTLKKLAYGFEIHCFSESKSLRYMNQCESPSTSDAQAVIETAHKLEQTAVSYDLAAAETIKALSEVSHMR